MPRQFPNRFQNSKKGEALKIPAALVTMLLFACCTTSFAQDGKHLFILSGQSNMQGHRPDEAFTPSVEEAFGKENVIVIQDAQGGQPILRWYKDFLNPAGKAPEKTGDLYDRLMNRINPAIKAQKLASISFFWMQGENDARRKNGDVYEASLRGLHKQLCEDLKRNDIAFIIGRLSDFDMENKRYPDWTKIRDIQVKVGESKPNFAWINTDDLNDGKNRGGKAITNDLHYSGEGYKEFGRRLAKAAIEIIGK